MAGEITVNTIQVRPLTGTVIRRAIAAEALAFGDAVYISGSTGGRPQVSKASGAALATAYVWGVTVAPSTTNPGATSIAAGDACDVCVSGPVEGYELAAGTIYFVHDTPGAIGATTGTVSCIVGVAESTTTLFVRASQSAQSS